MTHLLPAVRGVIDLRSSVKYCQVRVNQYAGELDPAPGLHRPQAPMLGNHGSGLYSWSAGAGARRSPVLGDAGSRRWSSSGRAAAGLELRGDGGAGVAHADAGRPSRLGELQEPGHQHRIDHVDGGEINAQARFSSSGRTQLWAAGLRRGACCRRWRGRPGSGCRASAWRVIWNGSARGWSATLGSTPRRGARPSRWRVQRSSGEAPVRMTGSGRTIAWASHTAGNRGRLAQSMVRGPGWRSRAAMSLSEEVTMVCAGHDVADASGASSALFPQGPSRSALALQQMEVAPAKSDAPRRGRIARASAPHPRRDSASSRAIRAHDALLALGQADQAGQ